MATILRGGLPGAASDATPVTLSSATVLVPMLNLGVSEGMIELAALLAAGAAGAAEAAPIEGSGVVPPGVQPRVVALGVVEVPQDQPLTSGLDMARSYRALLDFLPDEVVANRQRVRVEHVVRVARSVPDAVRDAACDEQAGLALFYWKGYARQPKKHVYGRTLDAALQNPPYDVALVRPGGWHDARRVLLPVRGGPSAERALKLALSLAEGRGLPLTVLHNVPTIGGGINSLASQVAALGEEPYMVFNEHLQIAQETASVPVESILTIGDDPMVALMGEMRSDDLIIMGMAAPSIGDRGSGVGDQEVARPLPLAVAKESECPMLVLRAAGHGDIEGYANKARDTRPAWSGSDMPYERWFVENTYHGDEFRDPDDFVRMKRASGLSLSIVLLTLNDERHIYSLLTGLKRVLQEMHPIADQIVVVDAGSTDGTVKVARDLGAEVYRADALLPEHGRLYGRGESWWKSLSILKGDVCVWLDPRARRFHPSTAMSLAGPLLRVPTLQLVKAFETPHANEARHRGDGDGNEDALPVSDMNWGGTMLRRREQEVGVLAGRIRVQALKPSDLEVLSAEEIAALPPNTLLQVLCPPLSGVIAPFSKDMAGRREAMLQMPALAGEYNEVSLLLSVASEYGTRAIAQVELRHARLASAPQPGMQSALDVLQALERRLLDPEAREYASQTAMRLQREMEGEGQDGMYEVRALGPMERPPMRSVMRDDLTTKTPRTPRR